MPFRLSKIRKALRKHGVTVSTGSRHWRAGRDGKTYPIPAHNGLKTEIDDSYILGVCRAFGLDHKQFIADLKGSKKRKKS